MINNKLHARWKFHPRHCGSPDSITPEQVLHHHSSGRGGGRGETGSCPLLHSSSVLNFISRKRNSTEPKKGVFFLNNSGSDYGESRLSWEGIKAQVRQSRDMSLFLLTSLHRKLMIYFLFVGLSHYGVHKGMYL